MTIERRRYDTSAQGSAQRRLRILLVDDDPVSVHALARLLRHEGHGVTAAHTLAAALVLGTGRDGPPDLLVCDIDLPDGDGCKLLRELRASYCGRALAAAAMTGFGDEWVERCREAGYGWFVTKPLRFELLLTIIQESVAGRRITRSLANNDPAVRTPTRLVPAP